MFYPGAYAEDVFSIDYAGLYSKGYRAIVFDIDNTLVPHGADATAQIEEFFRKLQTLGLKTCLLSNNDRERVERFCRNIETLYVCDAEKPGKAGLRKACRLLGVPETEVVLVGDQLFTDIFCANRCGIDSILVKFIGYYTETELGIRREVEKRVLDLYARSRRYQKKLGDMVTLSEETGKRC